jgi:hypothetical protein
MDRDHGICRSCEQIVRRDWRVCAHCGVSTPIPRTSAQRLTSVVMVVMVAGAAWWAVVGADGSGLGSTARGVVRSATAIEGHGGAMAPSASSGPVTGGRFAGGGGTGLPASGSGTTGVTSGGGTTGVGPSDGAGATRERDGAQSDTSGPLARLRASLRSVRGGAYDASTGLDRADSTDCGSAPCGRGGATRDPGASVFRRGPDLITGSRRPEPAIP